MCGPGGGCWNVVGILSLLVLGARFAALGDEFAVTWTDCVSAPAEADGEPVLLLSARLQDVSDPRSYVVVTPEGLVRVVGGSAGLVVGQAIGVRGRFRALDGVLVEEQRETRPFGVWKEALGVMAVVGALAVALRVVRISNGKIHIHG